MEMMESFNRKYEKYDNQDKNALFDTIYVVSHLKFKNEYYKIRLSELSEK